MSSRWYPIYQKGNPQLRIFLPNFWMRVLKPKSECPPNVVHFGCSMEMTRYDIENYLKKIYKIPVVHVRTYIRMGPFRRALGRSYIVKDDDERIAVVTMPKMETFKFPDLFPKEKEDEIAKQMEQVKEAERSWTKNKDNLKMRPGIPTWFSI